MKSILISAFLASVLLCSQQNRDQQNRAAETPQVTVRSTSQEVLLDVVVRDKKGRLVKNLTAKDFELTDDGERQTIRSFRQVKRAEGESEAIAPAKNASGAASGANPTSAAVLDPLPQGRIITLVFNPLGLDARSNARVAVEELLKTD